MDKDVSIKQLYTIFFGKELVKVSKYTPKTPTKQKTETNIFTPISKAIYQATSPTSKPYILEAIKADTEKISKMEKEQETIDPDYREKLENNGLGLFMEDYVSYYGFCPVCGQQTLQKYLYSNVPVVDLVCINKDYHLKNNKCFLFQVKISLTNEYFNLVNKQIIVGSKKYGVPAQVRKGDTSILDKIVVPGYICIKLNRKMGEAQEYNIDYRNSFVLVPDYQNFSDKNYYQYIEVTNKFNKNVITWNDNMVNTISLHKVLQNNVVKYELFFEKIEENPYRSLIKKLT